MPGGRVPAAAEPAVWATFLSELQRWAVEHGAADVPVIAVTTVDGRPFHLGSRAKNARVRYYRGTLKPQRVAELEAITGWSWEGRSRWHARVWQRRMTALRAYVEQHGSLTGLHDLDDASARWLRVQRTRKELTVTQRDELDTLPGLGPPTLQERLDVFLDVLSTWLDQEPGRTVSDLTNTTRAMVAGQDVPLGAQGAAWRARRREGRMPADVEVRLSAVAGWRWEVPTGRRPQRGSPHHAQARRFL